MTTPSRLIPGGAAAAAGARPLFLLSKVLLLLPLLLLLPAALGSCGRGPGGEWRALDGAAWHTTYHVTYRGPAGLEDSVVAVLARVEASASAFCPTSLVSAINAGASCRADSLLVALFRESRRVSALSGGAFDPTVGPLVDLWGFGPAGAEREAPTPLQVDSARALVGIGRWELDTAAMTLRRPCPGARLDFSAIAKGAGCDMVAAALRRAGCTDYLVEIGGEVVTAGRNPQGRPWRIQVDAPSSGAAEHRMLRTVPMPEGPAAMATSGNYRNYRDLGGATGRVGHTLDPRTGMPARRGVLSATVTAPACMTADALATACMVLPPDSALAMVGRAGKGVEALLVLPGAAPGTLRVVRTAGFGQGR